jgi:adenylate cyclase
MMQQKKIGTVPVEAIRNQTSRILASSHFSRSQALSRFLQFVVEETIAGNEHELKEYRLGVDVFDRGADFDPRIDPIVRMQAAKLRSRLAEYYNAEGRNDELVISIQKGAYVPSFTLEQSEPPTTPRTSRAIAVLPFVSISADSADEHFSDGLTDELTHLLTSLPALRVVARTSAFCFKNTSRDIREIGALLNASTIIEGSVRKAGDKLRITVQLIEAATGYHLVSRAFVRECRDMFTLQEDLAKAILGAVTPSIGATAPAVESPVSIRPRLLAVA